ncbi:MAG: hypothetical protein J7L58_04225 [Thermoplasmata archaeon]|nr:hypothetical protein [Thermoplasmata archaeon]
MMMARKLLVVATCLILLFPLASESSGRQKITVKFLPACSISIAAKGKSSWLSGEEIGENVTIKGLFVNIEDGETKVKTLSPPYKSYTFSGRQFIFLFGYRGKYSFAYIDNEATAITYNGVALYAVIVAIN